MLITKNDFTTVFNESTDELLLRGKSVEADVRHQNGFMYPKEVLKQAFLACKERVENNTAPVYVNLEHPESHENILSSQTCGVLDQLDWDDATGIGYVTIKISAKYPMGQKVIDKYKSGGMYGISQRARGIPDDLNNAVEMTIYTFDVVELPSCKTCTLKLNESVNVDVIDIDDGFEVVECDCKSKEVMREYLVNTLSDVFKNL